MARPQSEAALIWCPCPDRGTALALAAALLDARLVACANILGEIESHFLWEGRREISAETGALFKTTAALLPRALVRLGELHPYDTPAIVGWRVDAALPTTIAWLAAATDADG